ncbi:MAG: YqjK-like family protein [Thiohalomonadaceae bacterium]
MNKKLLSLAERRERLVAQISTQRTALADSIEPWRMPLTLADQGLSAVRYLKHHPEWMVGVVILLTTLRSRRAGKWLGRGWVMWRLMYKLRGS